MRAKQLCVLTGPESRAKVWRQLNAFKHNGKFPRRWLFVVDLLFNVLLTVCGGSVFAFVFGIHYFVSFLVLQEDKRAGCFAFIA